MELSFRQRALLKVLAGGALYAWVFYRTSGRGDFIGGGGGPFLAIALGGPGALALMGLVELASRKSFNDLAAKWDALPGWKQAVIAVATVLGAIVLIFGPLLLIGWLTYDG